MFSSITKLANGIMIWTMNHNPSKNAFGYKMLEELNSALLNNEHILAQVTNPKKI